MPYSVVALFLVAVVANVAAAFFSIRTLRAVSRWEAMLRRQLDSLT
jgi:hypothetical protein